MKMNLPILGCLATALTLPWSLRAAESAPSAVADIPVSRVRTELTPVEPPRQVAKASDLISLAVKSLQGEKLGKVEDLVLDLEKGRIVQVIISSGGFLGIGDELSAVPPSAFHYDPAEKLLHLDVSKEALAQAPHFKRHEWPNLGDAEYVNRVYRAYNISPYFGTDADHSRPAVGRPAGGLTATDQGSSTSDVEMTRQIRKGIMDQETLSSTAKNVTVVTVDGRVTLRGQVDSEEEKRLIAEIAGRFAPANRIDNQLAVTSK